MEQVYQQDVETSLSRALPDIAYYMLSGFVCGTVLEAVMPAYDEEKDSVALFLEIFRQIALIVFFFMFINSKCGGRNGLIVFILILVGSQPTLFEKIDAFRQGLFGSSNSSPKKETMVVDTPGSTSIDKLPKAEQKAQPVVKQV